MENQEYLALFIEESQENIQALNTSLLALEQNADDIEIIQTIFRAAHTLKGMAAAMNFENMAHLTHEMESSLDLLRSGTLHVDEEVLNTLFECVDVLQRQLDEIVESGSDAGISIVDTLPRIQHIGQSAKETVESPKPEEPDAEIQAVIGSRVSNGFPVYAINVTIDSTSPMPSVRGYMVKRAYEEIGEVLWSNPEDPAVDAFDGVLRLVVSTSQEMPAVQQIGFDVLEVAEVSVQPIHAQQPEVAATSMAAIERSSVPTRNVQPKSIRVGIDRLDALMNLYSELVIDKTRLEQLARSINHPELHETVQHLSRVGGDLQDVIMKIRMVPLETVFNRFPRMMRDLSKALNKQVHFEVKGEHTEIDRLLADEIADPLVHLLRNSMDHGLETPDERLRMGKTEFGTVRLSAYYAGNHVFLEIEDDGRGIQREKVLQKALSEGLIEKSEADTLSDEEVYQLLFKSGFSTAETVSDISGRGVGLDAVREKILALSGEVSVRSKPGEGSTFIIRLPLTVSILSAMLVEVGIETFALPTGSILHMDSLKGGDVSTVQGVPMWNYRGRWIPLIYLRNVFRVPESAEISHRHVAVLCKGDKLLALAVDEFIGQQEVVLKSLGPYLHGRVEGISGATILGHGQVALIVDSDWLIP